MRKTSFLTLLSIVFLLIGCKQKTEIKQIVRPVKTLTIGNIQELLNTEFPGVTQELKSSHLAFRVGGPLTKLNAIEGMPVKKGQIIAEIDSRDFKVDLTAKEARFIQARAEKERYERLLAKKSVSKNEYDQRLAGYLEAKSAFEAAKNALTDTKLRAPFTAFIDKKFVENYERVNTGQTIVNLLDLSAIEVKFTIPELLAIQHRKFKSFDVFFDIYKDVPFKANFKEIEKKSEGSAGLPITLVLEHKNTKTSQYKIVPGMSCKIKVNISDNGKEIEKEDAPISVPVSAIFEKSEDETKCVYVVNKETMTVSLREVKLGSLVSSNLIWVTEGLKKGEILVTSGVARLQDGQKIKFLN